MIETLKLRNFQAHKSLDLELGRVTALVGPTDAGKSACLRALRWACLNDLPGDDFIREGAEQVSVTVELKGAPAIVRGKGKTNLYRLGDTDYKAFGTAVPEDVAKLLSVSELNFQAQHDSPFWFGLSAPEVARQLNAVVNLSVIDSSLSAVAAEVRQARDRETICQERLDEQTAALAELEPQRDRIKEFVTIKARYDTHATTQENRSRLEESIQAVRRAHQDQLTRTEQIEDRVLLLELLEQGVASQNRRAELSRLCQELAQLQTIQAPPDWTPVMRAYLAATATVREREALEDVVDLREEAEGNVQLAKKRHAAAEEKFHNETHGKDCPLCHQSLPS